MPTDWRVFVDLRLHRQLRRWNVRGQMELDALQRVLLEGGPAALQWDSRKLVGCESWERIEGSYRGDIWLPLELDFIRVTIEVLPDRTVVIRPPD